MEKTTSYELSTVPNSGMDMARTGAALGLAALAFLFAWLCIAVQGFNFGINNNIFHIPIALHLYDLPQFAQDPFYQSLRKFVSVFWPLVGVIADESNLEHLFFELHLAAYAATFSALIWLLIRLGCNAFWQILLALSIAALSPILQGFTRIGVAELLPAYLTHSEFVHPFLLVAIGATVLGRPALAFASVGLLFNLNAFMAVWIGFVAVFAFLASAWFSQQSVPIVLRRLVRPLALGILLALPTTLWILSTVMAAEPLPAGFDFRVFLREYFPDHTLIETAGPRALLELLCKFAVAGAGLEVLRIQRLMAMPCINTLKALVIGSLLLFAVGVILPYITSAPLILNLHLLRSVLLIHWMAVVIALATALLRIQQGSLTRMDQMLIGVQGIGLALGIWPLLALALALQWQPYRLREPRHSSWTALVLALPSLPIAVLTPTIFYKKPVGMESALTALFILSGLSLAFSYAANKPTRLMLYLLALGSAVLAMGLFETRSWLGSWPYFITGNMSPFAVVAGGAAIALLTGSQLPRKSLLLFSAACLIPLLLQAGASANVRRSYLAATEPRTTAWHDVAHWARDHLEPGPVLVPLLNTSLQEDFQWLARRPVWVNWKQGAAVMWSPGFYSQWRKRYFEVKRLKTLEDKFAYACANNIPYVLEDTRGRSGCIPGPLAYGNASFCLYAMASACSLPENRIRETSLPK
jgi:hypothetical protein